MEVFKSLRKHSDAWYCRVFGDRASGLPAGDAIAIAAKARRVGVGGTTGRYASGVNWIFRRILSGPTLKTALKVGSRATPPLAIAGTFTASYNATIAAQCLAGILE